MVGFTWVARTRRAMTRRGLETQTKQVLVARNLRA
jgi:hypothetical protein